MTSFTHTFIIDLAVNQFIYERLGITHTIHDHQALGAHTDIILFRPGIIQTFQWSHPAARPIGHDTSSSVQCPNCSHLGSVSPKCIEMDSSKLRCSECQWEDTFKRPHDFNWCQGDSPKNKQDRGAWLKKEEKDVGMSDLTLT